MVAITLRFIKAERRKIAPRRTSRRARYACDFTSFRQKAERRKDSPNAHFVRIGEPDGVNAVAPYGRDYAALATSLRFVKKRKEGKIAPMLTLFASGTPTA